MSPVKNALLPDFILEHDTLALGDGDYENEAEQEPAEFAYADVISSRIGGYHRPVLDIDFGAALIPSTTPGHYHLYLDSVIGWDEYAKLLKVMGEIGLLEEGYVDASLRRGYTAVRLPWRKKETTA